LLLIKEGRERFEQMEDKHVKINKADIGGMLLQAKECLEHKILENERKDYLL
jgi:hypothetical protein